MSKYKKVSAKVYLHLEDDRIIMGFDAGHKKLQTRIDITEPILWALKLVKQNPELLEEIEGTPEDLFDVVDLPQ